jgi:site-specific recombinase XerD
MPDTESDRIVLPCPIAAEPTITEVVDLFLEERVAIGNSPITVRTYRHRLNSFLDFIADPNRPIAQIDYRDVNRYMGQLRGRKKRYTEHASKPEIDGGLAPATLLGFVQTQRTFWAWAVLRRFVVDNPASHLKRPKWDTVVKDKVPTATEVELIREQVQWLGKSKFWRDLRDAAMWMFLADTAARLGELVSLTLATAGHDAAPRLIEGEKVYTAYVVGKTGAGYVYYGEATAAAMRAYVAVRPEVGGGSLWVYEGGALQGNGVYQAFKRIAQRAGLDSRFGPQSLRHLNGFVYTTEGNLALAQRKLRHKAVTTTAMFYAHQDDEEVMKGTARLQLSAAS